jgi:hypothetical protein
MIEMNSSPLDNRESVILCNIMYFESSLTSPTSPNFSELGMDNYTKLLRVSSIFPMQVSLSQQHIGRYLEVTG